ncbi:hypothetical protein HPB47_008430 [Ixodes persulcatus]|uniref:Uncharacterized protein n=1 Tax=Ixodes persulcatus TaxID=34615 RepID=A0AC60P4V3_IXOPE|nr:hypothetical protein HPB47_008430 [Ixodes persulcatus]
MRLVTMPSHAPSNVLHVSPGTKGFLDPPTVPISMEGHTIGPSLHIKILERDWEPRAQEDFSLDCDSQPLYSILFLKPRVSLTSDSHSTVSTDVRARAAERLSFARSATAKLAALPRALSLAEAESTPDRLVILSDSKAALTQHANPERAPSLIGESASAAIMLQR